MFAFYELEKGTIGAAVVAKILQAPKDEFLFCARSAKTNTDYNKSDALIINGLTQNKIFQFKKEAWKNKEYDTYLWIDPENRATSMQKIIESSSYDNNKLGNLICKSWCHSEHTLEDTMVYKNFFERFAGCEYFEKTKKDLPETFTVYRAGSENGISWTTNKETALFFQGRYKDSGLPEPEILEKEVSKKDVICYIQDTGESEVIILPSTNQSNGGNQTND